MKHGTLIASSNRNIDCSSILLFQGAFFVATLLMLFGLWNNDQCIGSFIKPLCVLFSLHFAWCFWSWRVTTGRWFDAYTVFLLSLCLFNGGHFLLETFGLNRDGILQGKFDEQTVFRTILLVNAAVVAYHFGGLLLVVRKRRGPANRRAAPLSRNDERFSAERATAIGILFLIASLPAVWQTLSDSVKLVAAGGYMSLFQRELLAGIANWQDVLSQFFVPGILITFAMFHKSPQWVKACWALMLGYIATNMIIGDRGTAMSACIPLIMLHHHVVKKFKPIFLVATCFGVFVLLPVIAQIRCVAFEDRYSLFEQMIIDNPFVATISEMGGSAQTIAYTTKLVPGEKDYDYGIGYLYATFTTVPNLFWERHLSMEKGSYSQWLVWTVAPRIAHNGGGLGYSVVAEAYANLSIFGPPIVMAILGFAVAVVVSWSRNAQSPFPAAMEAVLLSVILILPRAEMFRVCRPLVWFFAVPCFLVACGQVHRATYDCSVLPRQTTSR